MIIFILLGLGFLGGGITLIVDGWPYMVLERGFTQVIAGTVLACAGVILLALSRVLSELRRVRSTLSNAVMAASLASMATREEPTSSEAFALEPAQRRDVGTAPSLGPVSGALAGAAAGVLAGTALSRSEPGVKDSADDKQDAVVGGERSESDLFGVAIPAAEPEPTNEEPSPPPPAETDAALLPFDDQAWLDRELGKDIAAEPWGDATPLAEAEPQSASPELAEDEGDKPKSREDDPFASALEQEVAADVSESDRASTEPVKASNSEFDFLRESLSHLRVEPEPVRPQPRPVAESEITDAATWMSPWHGEPSPPAEQVSEAAEALPDADPIDERAPEPPAWPPATHPAAAPEPAVAAVAETESAIVPGEPDEPEADASASPDTAIAPEPAAPAASNEGVVGAYQVGDAHFTIYADGSIQARTPDGDYLFGSMDELKTYLASEKSRLGV